MPFQRQQRPLHPLQQLQPGSLFCHPSIGLWEVVHGFGGPRVIGHEQLEEDRNVSRKLLGME